MFRSAALTGALCLATVTAQGALIGRAPLTPGGTDYQAYYDTLLNITWLADGNLVVTQPFGVTDLHESTSGFGAMNWDTAHEWIAGMNAASYLSVSNWRLPIIVDTDGPDADELGNDGCNVGYVGTDCGWNVDPASGEVAHLYYITLGNPGGYDPDGIHQDWCDTGLPAPPACLINVGPFTHFFPNHYWSGKEAVDNSDWAWEFNARIGLQDGALKTRYSYVWAVRDGDIMPAAVADGPISVTDGVARIISVGANDTGFTDPVTVTVTTPPTKGTITEISPPGPVVGMTITYTANIGTVGADSFVYEMADGTPAADTATVTVEISPDTDGDGVSDATDNCTLVSNPIQCDSDADGYGNRCDGDMNNDATTNSQDFVLFRPELGTVMGAPYDKADINCNGVANSQDYVLFRSLLGAPPGPSGLVP